jgi:hypothetical protein
MKGNTIAQNQQLVDLEFPDTQRRLLLRGILSVQSLPTEEWH